jgi:serine/threonine protein kinase
MPKARSVRLMKNAIVEGIPPTFMPVGRRMSNDSQLRSKTAVEFVRSLLIRDPEQRPSAIDALNMEYMAVIKNNCHAQSIDLPSLQPMISLAKKAGVFENQDVHNDFEIDALLNELQMERHQVPLFKRRPGGHNAMRHSSKTAREIDSKEAVSENMSMPSTVCPSDASSRILSKTSMDSRSSSKHSFEKGLSSKTSVESRFSSKHSVESSTPTKRSDENNSLSLCLEETSNQCLRIHNP